MKFATKLATLAATATASFLAPKLVTSGWKLVTGQEPPEDGEEQDRLTQVLVFAAVSAVVSTMLTQLAVRGTDRVFARSRDEEKDAKAKGA